MVSGTAAALILLVCGSPPSVEGAGVRLPEEVQAGEKTLRLNGAGVRKKFGFKVYLVALYLEECSTDPEWIVASDHAKAVRLVFLRNVGRGDILEEFELGFRDNSEDQLPELLPQLGRVRAIIPDMRKGQMLTFLYQPGIGTIIEREEALRPRPPPGPPPRPLTCCCGRRGRRGRSPASRPHLWRRRLAG